MHSIFDIISHDDPHSHIIDLFELCHIRSRIGD